MSNLAIARVRPGSSQVELTKGTAIPKICKTLGIPDHRWRNWFGKIKTDEAAQGTAEGERLAQGPGLLRRFTGAEAPCTMVPVPAPHTLMTPGPV